MSGCRVRGGWISVRSLGGHLDEQAGFADVAEVGGEEPGGEGSPDEVEQERVLDVAPWHGIA